MKKHTKTQKHTPVVGGLIATIVILALALGAVLIFRPAEKLVRADVNEGTFVSLGMMEYKIVGDRAIKRNDAAVRELREFLTADAKKSLSENCKSVHYNLQLASPDETQLYLKYGCDYPSAQMFAIKENEGWKLISPTNQFDMFGLPECGYVDKYTIHVSLAPVCFTDTGKELKYTVRK